MKTLISKVSLDGIELNGVKVTFGVPLDEYLPILGRPSRSVSHGPPAPYGHRNNVIHFYDRLGLLLREHHETYAIEGIDILLDTFSSRFPTSSPFQGELWVCGVRVVAGMRFAEFENQCEIKFRPHLGHSWYVDGRSISIQLEVVSPLRTKGSRKTNISEVAVGFRGAHRFNIVKV